MRVVLGLLGDGDDRVQRRPRNRQDAHPLAAGVYFLLLTAHFLLLTSDFLLPDLLLPAPDPTPYLSPQELVDCVENPKHCGGTGGCEGATQPLGFEYAEGNGMASSKEYPYKGRDGTCQMTTSEEVAGIKDYVHLPTNNYTALMYNNNNNNNNNNNYTALM